jgi:hypothetical protein
MIECFCTLLAPLSLFYISAMIQHCDVHLQHLPAEL